ncbi:MtN3 and saliva related transmembrane protein [Pantoea ananatis]|jgi:MtN3 and saliva related transmembrane protein|uniref:SemiSWEET family sugar transporter n=1 Tax=Pantoea ananas TaxID=553 RepID=UPI000DC5D287|nr:SemiSWEET transporter [Pantoea ananatis]RAR72128.1 MtN3 and saliva related transmembrane protein [Pantoea ananatis]
MDTTLIIGLFAAFFTTFAFAPQSIKTLKTRNTEGISVVMYIMFLIGVISWIIYGFQKSDLAVFAANIITLFLAAPVLVMTLLSRKKDRS